MLVAENVNMIFRQGSKPVHAVKEASIRVEKGERVYIHGPSGAGKSTLLHIMGGLCRPTKGKITVDGKSVYNMGDRKRSRVRNRRFGFIFQFYHLLPELNVLENVMLPGRIKGGRSVSEIKAAAEDLIDVVGMTARLKHRPGKLSGGEVQRAAIARALINEPEVLFCDEPTGNLDSAMSVEIYDLIKKLSQVRHMSVMLVSHQEVEKGFFDSEYFMRDGVMESVTGRG
jgi:ABC-type lipoprotein export system ATPase subunit